MDGRTGIKCMDEIGLTLNILNGTQQMNYIQLGSFQRKRKNF